MRQWGSVQRHISGGVLLGLVLLLSAWGMAQHAEGAWVAEFEELNPQLTDSEVAGRALVAIRDNRLHVSLLASGLPEGMHVVQIHGFTDNAVAGCPAADADTNGDGIVDAREAEATSGTALIPLHFELAKVDVPVSDTYPVASAGGILTYSAVTSADRLASALADNFYVVHWNLGDRVIFIYGVAEGTELPDTVASLQGLPAEMSVPVACARLQPL